MVLTVVTLGLGIFTTRYWETQVNFSPKPFFQTIYAYDTCFSRVVACVGLHRRGLGYRRSNDGAGRDIGGRYEPEDIPQYH